MNLALTAKIIAYIANFAIRGNCVESRRNRWLRMRRGLRRFIPRPGNIPVSGGLPEHTEDDGCNGNH